ncbi:MAG: hypothetical protein ACK2U2_02655 [Anaerolineae bacterium]|jgi:hypothetical protein
MALTEPGSELLNNLQAADFGDMAPAQAFKPYIGVSGTPCPQERMAAAGPFDYDRVRRAVAADLSDIPLDQPGDRC